MIRTKIFHVTAKGTMGLYEGKMVRQGGEGEWQPEFTICSNKL